MAFKLIKLCNATKSVDISYHQVMKSWNLTHDNNHTRMHAHKCMSRYQSP